MQLQLGLIEDQVHRVVVYSTNMNPVCIEYSGESLPGQFVEGPQVNDLGLLFREPRYKHDVCELVSIA